MATVTRSTTWADAQVLTATALNSEFNNLLNALALSNSDVASNAAIVYSKLSLTGGIVNADINSSAAIAASKLAAIPESGITFSGSGHGHTGGTDGKVITVRRGYGFYSTGPQAVANDVSWNPTAPAAQTATGLYVYARTAPVGSSLTVLIYNVTQARNVASVSISSGASTATTTSMTNAALVANDVLRMDITAIGSSTAGSDISATLDVTQP